MNKHSRLKKTAYHEAGHAVAYYFLHLPFKYVTIEPEEDSLGHLQPFPPPKSFHPDYNSDTKAQKRIEKEVTAYYAGNAAVFILTGKYDKGGTRDGQYAMDLADYDSGGPEETDAFLNWMWERTINWMQNPSYMWDAVETLAQELLKKRSLTSKEAKQIIKATYLKSIE